LDCWQAICKRLAMRRFCRFSGDVLSNIERLSTAENALDTEEFRYWGVVCYCHAWAVPFWQDEFVGCSGLAFWVSPVANPRILVLFTRRIFSTYYLRRFWTKNNRYNPRRSWVFRSSPRAVCRFRNCVVNTEWVPPAFANDAWRKISSSLSDL